MPPVWWSIGAAAFILLVLLVMFTGIEPPAIGKGTSYDASPEGYRGAYVVLNELGYKVARSRRAAGDHVLWVLSPEKVGDRDVDPLMAWVSRGGRMLLADPTAKMGSRFVPELELETLKENVTANCDREGIGQLDLGTALIRTKTAPKSVWARAADEDLVTIHRHGKGEVWLLHRPEMFRNDHFNKANNSVFVCRLAEAMTSDGGRTLAFDEFTHGMRDRPGVLELLWQRPVRWVTLHALALAGVILWRHGVRFGPIRTAPPPSRRSKEEFLDALTDLFRRQGDLDAAYRLVQQDLVHSLAEQMSLPATVHPDVVVSELARRRGADPKKLQPLFTDPGPPGGRSHFLDALRQLEQVRHEFLRS